jgi:hypothetical protein
MKLTVNQLTQLFDKCGDKIEIRYFEDIDIRGGSSLVSTDLVLPGHLKVLSENNLGTVEVFYNPALYECLSKEFPVEFRRHYGRASAIEIDRLLENMKNAGRASKRKRYIRLVGEAYGIDMHTGKRRILIRHDEPLDYRKWNDLKRDIDRNQVFLYRNSEVAVLIFVNLTLSSQKTYIERFKINTDLISLMVSRGQEPVHSIAPDFIPTEDVVSVTDPESLLEEYIRTNARLIIIGEKLEETEKRALLRVRNYDKFVRLLIIPVLDHRSIGDFFRQVKLVYNYDRWI